MTKIAPFRAVIFNQDKVNDLSKVVCPPYDVISPAQQQYFHELHPNNFIQILLGKDIPGEDKYQRSGELFKKWIEKEILIQDKMPAIYFYSQQYNIKGEKRIRLGFISLLRLPEAKASVFAHEHTRLEAKEDRFKLTKKVKANLSPVFVVFSDHKRIITVVFEQYIQDQVPAMEVTDDEKTVHKLWRIDSPELLEKIIHAIEEENIFIADGHHRFEVACAYRDEVKKRKGSLPEESDVNYVLSYFTNVESRGLTILPIHRLVKQDKKLDLNDFRLKVKDSFDLEEVRDKTRFFFLLEKAGATEHVFGMYTSKKYWLLRLKNVKILDKAMADKPKLYQGIDVAILNSLILKLIMGLNAEGSDKERIIFSAQPQDLIEKVDSNDNYVAFFLNAVKIQQVMAVALDGEKMPPKSTYFYPKVLSGLVINRLDS